jgi:hypothetical protein
MHEDLGVRERGELMPPGAQSLLQLGVVVDLPVHHGPHGAVLVAERLMAMLDIDDAQPPRAERELARGIEVNALVVGPAVLHRRVHGPHRRAPRVAGLAADAAHCLDPT